MLALSEKLKDLEKRLEALGDGKKIVEFSADEEELKGIKSLYQDKYQILGPHFLEDQNKYCIHFIRDKSRAISLEGYYA